MSEQNKGLEFSYDFAKISEELYVRPEVLKRLVLSFSKTLSEKLTLLDDAFKGNDIIKMRALLHEIRGTSGNLRLNSILDSAKTMHEAVKAGNDTQVIGSYFDTLKSHADQFDKFVAQFDKAA